MPPVGKAIALALVGLALGGLLPAGGCGGAKGNGGEAGPSDTPPAESAQTSTPPAASVSSSSLPPELPPELKPVARLIGERRTALARQVLSAHLEGHPDDGHAEFLLGLSFHREKRYALAKPHFARAVELAPEYHPTYHFQGWCLYWLGETGPARTAFEAHLGHAPTEGDSHFGLGVIDLDEDRLDDAERRFRRAIELQAGNPRRGKDVSKAHARLADIHIRRDDLPAARAELIAATGLWPEHYAAFYKLSRVLRRLGENEAADEAFESYRIWQKRVRQKRGVPEPAR